MSTDPADRALQAEMPGIRLRRSLGFLLQDASRLMRRRFILRAREAALPLNQSETAVLQHVAHEQGVNQAKLATQLDIEPITLVRLLDRLQDAKLIERRPHPSDRRSWTIWLTDEAGPMLDRIDAIRLAVRREALGGLTPAQYEALVEALVHIRANLAPRTDCRSAQAESGTDVTAK